MKVLVTGAAGFLGTHVVERLLAEGHTPIAVDDFEGAISRTVKQWYVRETRRRGRFDFFENDVSEPTQIAELIRSLQPEAVIHLAALHTAEGEIPLADLHRVNATGTLNVLEACRRASVKRVLVASSWEVYGREKPPMDELTTRLEPQTPLGITKLLGEHYARVYSRLFHLQVCVLRFFPLYGPRQRPDMAFARVARSVVRKEATVLPDHPDSRFDYTYVEDAAEAVAQALARDDESGIYNVGTGVATRLRDAVAALERILGAKAKLGNGAGLSAVAGYAGTARAKKDLGFEAKVDLATGLKRYADWYASMRPTVRMVK
jgi:nucleoside-diphosphate-sugar epimerase